MYRHFIRKALRHGAVFQALCAVALAFPQSAEVAVGPDHLKDAAALHNLAAEYASQKQFARRRNSTSRRKRCWKNRWARTIRPQSLERKGTRRFGER
jgi:hypothetical protein